MSRPVKTRSQEIVTELRRRIEAGELTAGERLPSTREITRRWGVAMATATKALSELQREGLARAVPGVGTVVAESTAPEPPATTHAARLRTTRRSQPDGALTRDRIAATAVAIADAEGLSAVSMRRVAVELGVATMTLYRHVADKEALLLAMLNAALGEVELPDEPPPSWRERVEVAARLLWSAFRAHPWGAAAMSVTRPQPLLAAMPFTEWMLAALGDVPGLSDDREALFTAYLTLINYIRGIAINIEMEAEAEALTGLNNDEYMETQEPLLQEITAGGAFPVLASLFASDEDYDLNLDVLFEYGVQRLLDGIAAHPGIAVPDVPWTATR
jgi:AcrR family transcriptional regulator